MTTVLDDLAAAFDTVTWDDSHGETVARVPAETWVEFANAAVITRLGTMLDALEDRGVGIRIVGLGHLASVRID